MTKTEFKKSLRECFRKEFVRKAELDRELHMKKGTAAWLLKDTPFFGSPARPLYHIDEVADAIWNWRSL